MCVCIYQLNIFLWYISIAGKYLKWKNHIDLFILNEVIIGSSHILSSQSLNISISFFHLLHFIDVNSLYVVSYPCIPLPLLWYSIIDLLFQLMFVCFYWWNIFLWYISIGCKYLNWKNHIALFILNDMIIGSSHILSSQSLNISVSYFHALHFFVLNSLYVILYPYISLPLLWWSIIGPFVSIDVCLYLLMEYVFMTYCCRE